MIVSSTLGWLRPYELQWLAYPPEVARQFSGDLADLADYRLLRPDLGNGDGRCPSGLLSAAGAPALGAVDALARADRGISAVMRGARRRAAVA